MRSIMHDYWERDENFCYRCGKNRNAGREKHHVFGAANRKLSDADGLWVYLCGDCHRLVHKDPVLMGQLHYEGREAYLAHHTLEEFMKRYGRFYGKHNPDDRDLEEL